jgi:nicotinate-nucleotide adenylyltransferase
MHRHIGIYSGTFDPIHQGHVAFAKEAINLFHLDKVIFLPEKTPRRKKGVSDISTREVALKKAISSEPKLESHIFQTNQFTTLKTLPELHQLLPGSTFTLLLGSDVALHLPKWQDLPMLIAGVSFVVAMREGDSRTAVERMFQQLEKSLKTPIRYTIIDSPHPDLSSSQLKKSASNR